MSGLEVSILGPLGLRVGGRPVELSGPRQRAVVAALAIRANNVVSTDAIIDDVWGDDAPDRVGHSLQQHISGIRKLLSEAADGDGAEGASLLVTRDPGYLLVVEQLDADRFEAAASGGAEALASGRHADALVALDDALAWWRGPVLVDVPESSQTLFTATRLDERRLAVLEDRVDTLLALDRARDAVPELDRLVSDHPYRERMRYQQMLALYRSGRQTDALAAYQATRRTLIDGLGIEPSTQLRDLEQRILEQSAELDLGSVPASGEIRATFRADTTAPGSIELPDGQIVVLADGAALMGRDVSAPIRLSDSRVSRRHAEVVTIGGESMITDLGSTNGTFVDGIAVTRAVLSDDAVVSLGGVELRYRHGR